MEANFDILRGFQLGPQHLLDLDQHGLTAQPGQLDLLQQTSLALAPLSGLTEADLAN